MIQLHSDVEPAFERVRDQRKPQKLDVLVGYFGVGAASALKKLGFTTIRLVFGLPEASSVLTEAKIRELRRLMRIADVRTSAALHAKLYIIDSAVVIIGSANLTRSGFRGNQETILVTDDIRVLKDAQRVFKAIWKAGKPVKLSSIKPATPSAGKGEDSGNIGRRRATPSSLFGSALRQPDRKRNRGQPSSTERKVRICAYPQFRFVKELQDRRTREWSASPLTRKGDVHIFCVSKTYGKASGIYDEPKVDTVHSVWEATSDSFPRKGWTWPHRATFKRVLVLKNPVPKDDLKKVGLIMDKRRVGWPRSNLGKMFRSVGDVKKLADVLSKRNPAQASTVCRVLHLTR